MVGSRRCPSLGDRRRERRLQPLRRLRRAARVPRWLLPVRLVGVAAPTAVLVGAVERFDAPLFSIPPSAAHAMEPRQRLLLEVGYVLLHGSSHRRAGRTVGVSATRLLS